MLLSKEDPTVAAWALPYLRAAFPWSRAGGGGGSTQTLPFFVASLASQVHQAGPPQSPG